MELLQPQVVQVRQLTQVVAVQVVAEGVLQSRHLRQEVLVGQGAKAAAEAAVEVLVTTPDSVEQGVLVEWAI
jgi:hypothetical protein